MRTMHEAIGAMEAYSPAEERLNRRRRTAGLIAAPLAFVTVLLVPMPSLQPAAHRLAAIAAGVGVLWVTEALPPPVTALLVPLLAAALRVAPAAVAFAPFADPIIFLFVGSFMLAEAMFVHGLDRRVAFTVLSARVVGGSPARLLLAYGAVGMFVSMWISNTATAAMLFPIGLAIIAHAGRQAPQGDRQLATFAMVLMLVTSFAPSIGGMATPVGTPPNLIGQGMLERITGYQVSFFAWMGIGLPVVLALSAFMVVYFGVLLGRGAGFPSARIELAHAELDRLGPMTRAQRNVAIAFGVTVLLWVAPGLLALAGLSRSPAARAYQFAMPEGVAALVGAVLLFLLPVNWSQRRFTLSWSQAVQIDWGIVLLYGGGLALGELAFTTGLAEAAGHSLASWLPVRTTVTLTALFAALSILLSEATSNTAAANLIVPIAIAVAEGAGVRPLEPAIAATLGASMGFLLPISTAPNAIVYSSGHVPVTSMMRHGLALDVAAFLVIVPAVLLACGVMF